MDPFFGQLSAVQPGSHTASSFDLEEFFIRVDLFVEASSLHKQQLSELNVLEHTVSSQSQTLWSKNQRSVYAAGRCECGTSVNDVYPVAALNEEAFASLSSSLERLRVVCARDALSSQISITIAEKQTIDAFLLHTLNADVLQKVFPRLVDTAVSKSDDELARTFLQKLVLLCGAMLVRDAEQPTGDSLLLDLGVAPVSTQTVRVRQAEQHRFVFEALVLHAGTAWAACLLQPTLDDIRDGWLDRLCTMSANGLDCAAFVRQVPWADVVTLTEQDIASLVLVPLQTAMHRFGAASAHSESILLQFASVIALIAHLRPTLTSECVALLCRAPWPCRLLASPLYVLFQWTSLEAQKALLVFRELYILPSLPQEHVLKSEGEKGRHRLQIAQLLLQHHAVIERVYASIPELSNANLAFPLLETIATVALQHAATASEDPLLLCRILIPDYFFLAFGLSSQYPANIEHPLRSEAAAQLLRLCTAHPALITPFISAVAASLPNVAVNAVVAFVEMLPLSHYQPAEEVVVDLAYIMTARLPPSHADESGSWIQAYLLTPTTTPASGWPVAYTVMQKANWKNTEAVVRGKALVVLAGAVLGKEMPYEMLLPLVAAPHESRYVRPLLEIAALSVPHAQRVLSLIQPLILLAAAKASPSTRGGAVLASAGLYDRIRDVIARQDHVAVRLITQALAEASLTVESDASQVALLIGEYARMTGVETVLHDIVQSLRRPAHEQQLMLRWWLQTLAANVNDANTQIISDTLLRAVFLTSLWRDASQSMVVMPLDVRFCTALVQKNHPWLAAALLASAAHHRSINAEVLLGYVAEVAMRAGAVPASLLFWQLFFDIYFAHQDALNTALREKCSAHFSAMAAQTQSSTRAVSALFLSFTTWSSEVIPSQGHFLDAEDIRRLVWSETPAAQKMELPSPVAAAPIIDHVEPLSPVIIQDTSLKLDLNCIIAPSERLPDVDSSHRDIRATHEAAQELLTHLEGPSSENPLPLVESLTHLYDQYEVNVDSLELLDAEFLQLLRQQYHNAPRPVESMSVLHLITDVGQSKRRVCVDQIVRARQHFALQLRKLLRTARFSIRENRTACQRTMSDLGAIVGAIIRDTMTLETVVRMILEGKRSSGGAALFFALVSGVLSRQRRHLLSAAFEKYETSTTELAREFVANNPSLMRRFFDSIMQALPPVSAEQMATVSRTWLLKLFDPNCLLELPDGVEQYLSVLDRVGNAPLSEDEMRVISAHFDASLLVQRLEEMPSDAASILWTAVENMFGAAPFMSFACTLVTKISKLHFPLHVSAALNAVLAACEHGTPPAGFHLLFESVPLESMDVHIASSLLENLIQKMPAQGKYMQAVLSLVQRLLPAWAQVFPSWDAIHKLVSRCLLVQPSAVLELTSRPRSLSAPSRVEVTDVSGESVTLIVDIVIDLVVQRANLADLTEVCKLFVQTLLPFLKTKDTPEVTTSVTQRLSTLSWQSLHELVPPMSPPSPLPASPENTPSAAMPAISEGKQQLLDTLRLLHTACDNTHAIPFVRHVFTHIDWLALRYDPDVAICFLQLLVDLNIASAEPLPERLLSLARCELFQQTETETFCWDHVSEPLFNTALDGCLLTRLVEGAVAHDPSEKIMESIQLLFSLGIALSQPSAAVSVAREARSVMFFTVTSPWTAGKFWSLSAAQHVHIITNVFVPLTRKHTKSQSAIGPLLVNLLSCMEPPPARIVSLSRPLHFANQASDPFFVSKDGAYVEFVSKVKGLVLQVCSILSQDLALEILNTASRAVSDSAVLCEILEQTLQTFFTHTTDTSARALAAATLQILDVSAFVDACMRSHASLSLYVFLLQRQRQANASDTQWRDTAEWMVDVVRAYVPPQHRPFDALPLYLLLLTVAEDERWDADDALLEQLVTPLNITYVKGAREESAMELAVRSIGLFMRRIVVQKQHGQSGRVSRELLDEMDALLSLRNQRNMSEFEEFFDGAESLLSPMTEVADVREFLAKTLFPMAPYLENT